MLRTEFGVRNN